MKKLFIREPYLSFLLSGEKTYEGRLGLKNIKTIQKGEVLLVDGRYQFKVMNVKKYPFFKDAINVRNFKKFVPHAPNEGNVIDTYEKMYSTTKQRELGVVVLNLKKMQKDGAVW